MNPHCGKILLLQFLFSLKKAFDAHYRLHLKDGALLFSQACVCPHWGRGEGYPVPGSFQGVWSQVLSGGYTSPSQGVPQFQLGGIPGQWYPSSRIGLGYPPARTGVLCLPRQNNRASTCCASGSMRLAIMQEDFRVLSHFDHPLTFCRTLLGIRTALDLRLVSIRTSLLRQVSSYNTKFCMREIKFLRFFQKKKKKWPSQFLIGGTCFDIPQGLNLSLSSGCIINPNYCSKNGQNLYRLTQI